uniref:Uncharacterized protein n=1 Tax=Cacopsylla melanoneura TaxID=428564 RepID=A0A8D8S6Z2_9HEMI
MPCPTPDATFEPAPVLGRILNSTRAPSGNTAVIVFDRYSKLATASSYLATVWDVVSCRSSSLEMNSLSSAAGFLVLTITLLISSSLLNMPDVSSSFSGSESGWAGFRERVAFFLVAAPLAVPALRLAPPLRLLVRDLLLLCDLALLFMLKSSSLSSSSSSSKLLSSVIILLSSESSFLLPVFPFFFSVTFTILLLSVEAFLLFSNLFTTPAEKLNMDGTAVCFKVICLPPCLLE